MRSFRRSSAVAFWDRNRESEAAGVELRDSGAEGGFDIAEVYFAKSFTVISSS